MVIERCARLVQCLCVLALGGSLAVARPDGGRSGGSTGAETRTLDELKRIGRQVARGITEKNYASLYPLLCAADRAKTKQEDFVAMLREVHRLYGTKFAEVGTDEDILFENRKAGVEHPADLNKVQSVLLPIRLHFTPAGQDHGDTTSVQAWTFLRQSGKWCTPADG